MMILFSESGPSSQILTSLLLFSKSSLPSPIKSLLNKISGSSSSSSSCGSMYSVERFQILSTSVIPNSSSGKSSLFLNTDSSSNNDNIFKILNMDNKMILIPQI
eukprot:Anaeramoba_flamelloidesc39363_g1_i1.p1 GENE.c39363_g1_i1~~c39363_g1_i1.p1  ORF type:complete len:120 (+),score=3.18 c39363_g1_i1:50-361(+)